MTKLEPTRTSSDLTATERLRELLDERGADYRVSATGYSIDIGPYTTAYANRSDTTLDVSLRQVTPAQAVAATLGSSNYTNDCTNSERTETLTAEQVMAIAGRHQPDYCSDTHVCFDWQAIADELNATLDDVPRLPHFWTHDGTLHIEATRMPTRIVVCEGGTCEFVPKRELDASEAENAKLREQVSDACMQLGGAWVRCTELRELVRGLVYATHPADRARLIADAAEFGIEVDG